MKRINTNHSRGVSMVEAIIGVALILMVLTIGMVIQRTLFKGSVAHDNSARAQQKMRTVAEDLRYQATQFFDTLNQYVVPADIAKQAPNVNIFPTVGPIDQRTQTRTVTLRAEWREGIIWRSTSTTFSVMYFKAMKSGAFVHLKVVDATNSARGVENCKISMPGFNAGELAYGRTDSNGEAVVSGVSVTQNPLQITIEALHGPQEIVQNYYLFYIAAPTNAYSFIKNDIYVPNPGAGHTDETYLTTPLQAYPPGGLTILAQDTGNPVVNYRVRIAKIPMYNAPPDIPPGNRMTTTADGKAIFAPLLLGAYSPFGFGNESYAAVDYPESVNNLSTNPLKANINPGDAVSRTMAIAQRGSLQGTFYGLDYDGGSHWYTRSNSNWPAGSQISIFRTNYETWGDDGSASGVKYYLYNGYYYYYTRSEGESWGLSWQPLDYYRNASIASNGAYTLSYIAPMIFNFGISPTQQFGKITLSPLVRSNMYGWVASYWVPSPFVPVFVLPLGSNMNNAPPTPTSTNGWAENQIKMLVPIWNAVNSWVKVSTISANPSDMWSLSDWDVKVYGNTMNNADFYLLKNDSMANLSGKILETDGTCFSAAGLTSTFVSIDANLLNANDGTKAVNAGYLVYYGGDSNKSYMTSLMQVPTTNGGCVQYNMSWGGTSRPLLRNFGAQNTVINYYGQISQSNDEQFQGILSVRRKVRVTPPSAGVPAVYNMNAVVSNSDININNMIIYLWHEGVTDAAFAVNVANGNVSFTRTVTSKLTRTGQLKTTLDVGENANRPITLVPANATPQSPDYYVTADHDDPTGGNPSGWGYETPDHVTTSSGKLWRKSGGIYQPVNPTTLPLQVYQTGLATEISGTVTKNGVPKEGVQVWLYRITPTQDGSTRGSHWNTQAAPYQTTDIGGTTPGKFRFTNVRFNTSDSPEFKLTVRNSAGDYCETSLTFHGYVLDEANNPFSKTDANIAVTALGTVGCPNSEDGTGVRPGT